MQTLGCHKTRKCHPYRLKTYKSPAEKSLEHGIRRIAYGYDVSNDEHFDISRNCHFTEDGKVRPFPMDRRTKIKTWAVRIDKKPVAYAILPILRHCAPPMASISAQANFVNGIIHRIGRQKPVVLQEEFDFLVDTTRMINKRLFKLLPVPIMSFEHWLSNTRYTLARKKQLSLIHATMQDSRGMLKRCKVRAFIKREKFLEYKFPRMICARDDAFKCYSGRFFKSLENAIFSNACFIKHIPVRERAKYIVNHFGDVHNKRIFVNDHTSFEVHAHTTMKAIELTLYRMLLPSDFCDDVERVICAQQRINFQGGSAKVNSRMSGEMNTSLGNGLVNLISFYAVILRNYGDIINDCKCIIEGDDGIFVVPDHVMLTNEMFVEFGFVVKCHEVPTLGMAGFCSTYFLDDGSCAVIDPYKVVLGFGWSLNYRPTVTRTRLNDLRVSKVYSWVYEYVGVPMLQAVGFRLKEIYGLQFKRFHGDWYENQIHDWALRNPDAELFIEITNRTRVLFANVFGISPLEQLDYEEYVKYCEEDEIFNHTLFSKQDDWLEFYRDYVIESI